MEGKKRLKTNVSGITLIALVITIIVLLILAGVSISMISGDDGIVSQAANSKEKTLKGEEQELVNLAYSSAKIDSLGEIVTKEKMQEKLNNIAGIGKTEVIENADKDFNVKFIDTGNEYIVSREVEEVATIKVGDYVNYPVSYTNVASAYVKETNLDHAYPIDELVGWRVISRDIDEDGNVTNVKLISAGIPLNYYHYQNSSISISNLKENFLKTEIDSVNLTQYKFFRCGFDYVEGNTLEKTFANKYTAKVECLTKEDVGKEEWEDLKGEEYNNLYALPTKEYDSCCYTWLANNLYGVSLYMLCDVVCGEEITNRVHGIRPVVTLNSNVEFVLSNDKINNTTTWDIK